MKADAWKACITDLIAIMSFLALEKDAKFIDDNEKYIKAHDDGIFGPLSYNEKIYYIQKSSIDQYEFFALK